MTAHLFPSFEQLFCYKVSFRIWEGTYASINLSGYIMNVLSREKNYWFLSYQQAIL